MPAHVEIQFFSSAGKSTWVKALVGGSVMEAAVMANVEGIEAECGGCCSCATCHVYSSENLGKPDDDEDAMLEITASPRQDNSRLSCQLKVTAEMDGVTFILPEEQ